MNELDVNLLILKMPRYSLFGIFLQNFFPVLVYNQIVL